MTTQPTTRYLTDDEIVRLRRAIAAKGNCKRFSEAYGFGTGTISSALSKSRKVSRGLLKRIDVACSSVEADALRGVLPRQPEAPKPKATVKPNPLLARARAGQDKEQLDRIESMLRSLCEVCGLEVTTL